MTRLLAVTMVLAATLAMAGCDRPATDAGLPRGAALDPDNGGLILPDGFSAVVVFDGTGESREIFIRDDGDIFVSLSGLREGPHILGLRDEDGDWRIDRVERFFDVSTPKQQKVPRVHIAYRDGYLYAITNEQLVRLRLEDGRLTPTGGRQVIVDPIPYQSSHRGRTLSVDDDGWVYVNIGSPSNACQARNKTRGSPGLDPCPELDRHAGIWRWRWRGDVVGQSRADGEHYAVGLRNSIAQTWDPVYGALYVAQMGRDRLDSLWPEHFSTRMNADLPAEEFFRVEQGRHFGWPCCYYDPFQNKKVLAPEYGGDGRIVGRCAAFEQPLVTFPAHFSPSSIAFYHADHFPPAYRGGAFVALKGSWNRAPLPQDGFIVAFVPFKDGAPTGQWQHFADGFKGVDILYERSNAVYRPQSVAVHPDGSLYILDNNQGRIWRVMYTGLPAPERAADRQPTTDRALIAEASRSRGARLYDEYCASCHQPQGGGVPGEFPPLVGTDWVSGDKGRLIRSVLHGMQGPVEIGGVLYDEVMPAHDFLSDTKLAELLTYIRQEFGGGADPIHKSEVTLVRNVDARTEPWQAAELERTLGIPGSELQAGQ